MKRQIHPCGMNHSLHIEALARAAMRRDLALALLSECTGDDIWSVEHCRARRVPEAWIDELADAYESGFETDSQTIYYEERTVNQYHGVRDVDLARKLAVELGVNPESLQRSALTRAAFVQAVKEEVMDG